MSDSKRPPRSRSPHASAMAASDGSRMDRCRNQIDSPSASASNGNGRSELGNLLCSVLCHPLGLSLVSAFYGEDPRKLPHLRQESKYFSSKGNDNDSYNNVLKTAFDEWRKDSKKESKLTILLRNLFNGNNESPFKAQAEYPVGDPSKPERRVDISLFPKSDAASTASKRPLMFLEVGLNGIDWWKKFDQALKYVKLKYAEETPKASKGPLLLAVMTIDDTNQSKSCHEVGVKLGVFLCTPKKKKKLEVYDPVRISLLWHSRTCKLADGSNAFGRMLRRVCDFTSWLAKLDDAQIQSDYEYFNSNCCRVGNKVSCQFH